MTTKNMVLIFLLAGAAIVILEVLKSSAVLTIREAVMKQ